MKYSRVFRASSLLFLLLFLLLAGLITANYSGIKINYKTTDTQFGSDVGLEDYQTIEGDRPKQIKACFVLDSSNSGWIAVKQNGMLDNIKESLYKFSDQGHIIEFEGYSKNYGTRSTGAFLPIESSPESKLWQALNKFEKSYDQPWGDIQYQMFVENGIETLINSESCENSILIFIIGSPNTNPMTKAEIDYFKNKLYENNISLYIIGLARKGNNYDELSKLSDNVFKEVDVSEIEGIISGIFEDIAYNELDENPQYIELHKNTSDSDIVFTDVSLKFFSTSPFRISVDKLTSLSDGRTSKTAVVSDSGADYFSKIALDDTMIEDNTDMLRYAVKYDLTQEDQKVYVSVCNTTAKIAEAPEMLMQLSVFEWINTKYGIPAKEFAYVLCCIFGLLFFVPIIARAHIKKKYTNMGNPKSEKG